VPDDGQRHEVEYWDANVSGGKWYKTELDLKDTKQNIGGREVSIPGVKTANETTPMLYRIDGKILEKPDNLRSFTDEPSSYESPYPATLPKGFKPKEKKEERKEGKGAKVETIKIGRATNKPDEIPLTDDLKALRDSKDPEDKRLYQTLIDKGITEFNFAVTEFNAQQQNKELKAAREAKSAKTETGQITVETAAPKQGEPLTSSHLIKQVKQNGLAATIKEVYRFLTPWDETGGQTYIDYMKLYPERVKQSILVPIGKGSQPTQKQLKADYEAAKDAPLWQKLLGASPQIVYNNKTKSYSPIYASEAPGSEAVRRPG